jgi:hypothetical protein
MGSSGAHSRRDILEEPDMDKRTAGLLGAVAGLAAMGSAQAATAPAAGPSQTLQVASYADLLAPVQNAVEVMRSQDATRDQQTMGDVQLADDYYGAPSGPRYHHHHHHHHHRQVYYRHHHHHHHQQGTFVGIPGGGGIAIGGR